eukprot:CAMPEP_0182578328 /NCGR_PEP_ID=MMETSP1324-20130603/40711_1 /TAXON_ID=236786 /ORGANISM="Florenciella sp., Strain RCC1587" /LENGTH=59 /DNA_ID=CAMNT_0024794269 /DNA_START=34 /DNA_END=209 /DNA_ORIENTATION=+
MAPTRNTKRDAPQQAVHIQDMQNTHQQGEEVYRSQSTSDREGSPEREHGRDRAAKRKNT